MNTTFSSDDGRIFVQLCDSPLDLADLTGPRAASSRCGAISSFFGVTRDNFDGKAVELLEYEAYGPMAVKEMTALATEIATTFEGIHRVVFAHRLGVVPVGEASVVIVVSSEHRGDGLRAVQFGIDTLKAKVPIWKKERYVSTGDAQAVAVANGEPGPASGESAWKVNKEFVEMVKQQRAETQVQ